ncbi:unnamed protein product [Parascedosporium putredinis]|uniref:Uncharacterized protein n=1 Tax=Parascedosporium putredinis TaxID=1442378 RepID=A0A9P1H1F2_9PEZI|nr:unnamed protein product [Parascedosporium putredinis]CAI7992666.1 unnamed protein product [Parascedosporium putredinis]
MAHAVASAVAYQLRSDDFRVHIDENGGHLLGIFDEREASDSMNWISAPSNAPWQPSGVAGDWDTLTPAGARCTGTTGAARSFGASANAAMRHALARRAHAHVWANGGATAWVKMDQMGGHGRDLGMVLTKGALSGYSIEGRDTISSSNTRGVFLLHPVVPTLAPGEEAVVEWAMFWHKGWDEFQRRCIALSEQFVAIRADSLTLAAGESTVVHLEGQRVNNQTTVDGNRVNCEGDQCSYWYVATGVGHRSLTITTRSGEHIDDSTMYLNLVPRIKDLVANRVAFITQKQQVSAAGILDGAYVLYDNDMDGQVLYDRAADRNAGRERVGMGIFIARWLRRNRDPAVEASLKRYYTFVCTRLQDDEGNVFNGPGDRGDRLYNWPWVLQLHLAVAALHLDLPPEIAGRTPLQRFLTTLDRFYASGGKGLYAIGLPVLEGLRATYASGDKGLHEKALRYFTEHAQEIAHTGIRYPPFEVNFEQSIVAPAAIILLEMYRWTGDKQWLEAGERQMETLLRFAGKQPDYRLHDIAIRHWDGYWFGKDRVAKRDEVALGQAQGIIRSNLALFQPDGRGHCAWIYPLSVNGRAGHYRDPWSNDQDFALNHLLFLEQDLAEERGEGIVVVK